MDSELAAPRILYILPMMRALSIIEISNRLARLSSSLNEDYGPRTSNAPVIVRAVLSLSQEGLVIFTISHRRVDVEITNDGIAFRSDLFRQHNFLRATAQRRFNLFCDMILQGFRRNGPFSDPLPHAKYFRIQGLGVSIEMRRGRDLLKHLPVELLLEIGQHAEREDLKNLRATCQRNDGVLRAKVLSYLKFDPRDSGIESVICLLESLALNKTDISKYVRHLRIECLWPTSEPSERTPARRFPLFGRVEAEDARIRIETHLGRAIRSLSKLENLRCFLCTFDAPWIIPTIFKALSSRQPLSTSTSRAMPPMRLSMTLPNGQVTQWECLQHLLIHVPVEHLTVSGPDPPIGRPQVLNCDMFSDVLGMCLRSLALRRVMVLLHGGVVRSFHHLTSLRLGAGATANASFWREMETQAVQLRHLELWERVYCQPLFSYLSSYCGLEHLSLFPANDFSSDAASVCLAALAKGHSTTLRFLRIRPFTQGNWCFSWSHATILSKFKALRKLRVCVNLRDVLLDQQYDHQYPIRRHVVHTLLDTIVHLSSLKILQIICLDGGYNAHIVSKTAAQQICDMILSFSSQTASTASQPVVLFSNKVYRCSSSTPPDVIAFHQR